MIARRISTLSSRVSGLLWESRLGISTRGEYGEGDANSGEHRPYGTVPYRVIFKMLDSLRLAPDDVFVDIGSGKGRVICCAATYRVERVIGVDDQPYVHQSAQRNAARLRGKRAPITLVLAKAQEFDFTLGTVFYLFNPFGPETLRAVLRKLGDGVSARPRTVRVVYVNPRHDDLLEECEWLSRADTWRFRGMDWPAAVWRSR